MPINDTNENNSIDKYANAICEDLKPKRSRLAIFFGNWHWLIAGIVGFVYIVIGFFADGPEFALEVALKFLPIPLILIWFGDALGMVTGMIGLRPTITKTIGVHGGYAEI